MKNSLWLFIWLPAAGALAQSFSLETFRIAGGGGSSTNQPYQLTSTLGYAGTVPMQGGNYSVGEGFWGASELVQIPAAPLLSIGRANGSIVISWPLGNGQFFLEETPSFVGKRPWARVSLPYVTNNTTVSIASPPSPGDRCYRLRSP